MTKIQTFSSQRIIKQGKGNWCNYIVISNQKKFKKKRKNPRISIKNPENILQHSGRYTHLSVIAISEFLFNQEMSSD